ncbi:MAG TPA: hypothetical protein VH796_07005 [Nitrososphaeraceae archaeon]|jgi:hypothetical protein
MTAIKPPLQVENHLKKEASYGCIICGCPVLQYVNIVKQEIGVYLPENMVALCPIHTKKYDNNELHETQLRDAKNRPHNKVHEENAFALSSLDTSINVGKCCFVNTTRILVIDDFDIITIKRNSEKKYILFDVNFFDSLNNLKAVLSENSWYHEGADSNWTIYYEPLHFNMQKSSDSISFDAKIDSKREELTLLAEGFHYNGSIIKITQNEILVDNEEIALDLKGTTVKNYDVGIMFQTT